MSRKLSVTADRPQETNVRFRSIAVASFRRHSAERMIDITLNEGLIHWLNDNRDLAYFLGFVVISLGFFGLYPFSIGLNHATSAGIPFKNVDVGKQIRKRHRIVLVACAILTFAVLHFGYSMSGLALIGGSILLAALMILDQKQIHRDNPRQP